MIAALCETCNVGLIVVFINLLVFVWYVYCCALSLGLVYRLGCLFCGFWW